MQLKHVTYEPTVAHNRARCWQDLANMINTVNGMWFRSAMKHIDFYQWLHAQEAFARKVCYQVITPEIYQAFVFSTYYGRWMLNSSLTDRAIREGISLDIWKASLHDKQERRTK